MNENTQRCFDCLTDELLGKDFYIDSPLGGNQARQYITREIMKKYGRRARNRYKREIKLYKAIILVLVAVSVISASISIYCIYDRVQLTNQSSEYRTDIDRYKSEIANMTERHRELEQELNQRNGG